MGGNALLDVVLHRM